MTTRTKVQCLAAMTAIALNTRSSYFSNAGQCISDEQFSFSGPLAEYTHFAIVIGFNKSGTR